MTSGMIDASTSGRARCQNDMGSIMASSATRGHCFSYELSHCVVPKELSAAAARPHVPRMWALDLAQNTGRRREVQRWLASPLGDAVDPAIWPISLSLNCFWPLYCLVASCQARHREHDRELERKGEEEGGGCIL